MGNVWDFRKRMEGKVYWISKLNGLPVGDTGETAEIWENLK